MERFQRNTSSGGRRPAGAKIAPEACEASWTSTDSPDRIFSDRRLTTSQDDSDFRAFNTRGADRKWSKGQRYLSDSEEVMGPRVSRSSMPGQDHEENRGTTLFMDKDAMKETVRNNLLKEPWDVSKLYKHEGIWQAIARSPHFDKITLSVIAMNAIWIGVDTDSNSASVLLEADPVFQLAEHFFCLFFAFEWTTRFLSFQKKWFGLKDGWFVFDTILVLMMVLETWVLSLIMLIAGGSSSGGLGNASILRMARLARLSRMARMARLLRAMPELMILIKGIATATRSVFFTLCLLCLLLYIFAIAFTQLTVDTEVGNMYFVNLGASMYTLLVHGTLMDNIGAPLNKLGELGWIYAAIYLLFVLLATVTVMNMLIGVLCEVVSTVAAVEKETLAVTYVKDRMNFVLSEMDEDGNGTISRDEFGNVMDSKEAVETLNDVGIDVVGLTEFADIIFQDDEDPTKQRELSFREFMEIVLQFRGTNIATVKDVVDFHKFVKQKIGQTTAELRALKDQLKRIDELAPRRVAKSVVIEPSNKGEKVPIGKVSVFPSKSRGAFGQVEEEGEGGDHHSEASGDEDVDLPLTLPGADKENKEEDFVLRRPPIAQARLLRPPGPSGQPPPLVAEVS